MSQTPELEMRQDLPGGGPVGVIDALRMGWRLLMSDFWPLWLVALVAFAIEAGAGLVGMTPYIGGCISLAVGIFVQPALAAGLVYALGRRIDGAPVQVGDVFEGFRQRYWPSVVAILPLVGLGLVFGLVAGGIALAVVFGMGAFDGGNMGEEEVLALVGLLLVILLPLILIGIVVGLFFTFIFVAVWDHPESGWEAVKDSARVVKAHFWSTLGLGVLLWLLGLAAGLVGLIACGVGFFFTVPMLMAWKTAALVYLYRSWTGRPLVQPIEEAAFPPETTGPVPPTSIQPPPAM